METICADEIPPALVNETLEFAYQKGIVSQIYRDDDVVTEFKNPYTDRYIENLKLNCVICPEIRHTLNTGIPKILCFSEENRKNFFRFPAEIVANSFRGAQCGRISSGFKPKLLRFFS